MIVQHRYRLPVVVSVMSLLLAACGGSPSESDSAAAENCTPAHEGLKTLQEGALTVAAYVYPPFSDVADGGLTGAEGEIITRIAGMECLDIAVLEGGSAAMIPAVQSERADTAIGSWYRTAERAKIVRLGAPVIAGRLVLASMDGVSTIQDLRSLQVGSVMGFLANEDLKALLGDGQKLYDSVEALYADLRAGRVDVAVTSEAAAAAQLKAQPIEGIQLKVPPADDAVASTLKAGQTNFPVGLDNEALGKALDEDVAELRKSGDLAKILESYGFSPEAAEPGDPDLL
jgi:polar amino acid transport system substrate-binding protein